MIIKVPDVTIQTENGALGDNVALTSVSFGGSIFDKGNASVSYTEKPDKNGKYASIFDLAGKWEISLDGSAMWTGYVTNITSKRLKNFVQRVVLLTDQTEAWDVLLKEKVFPDPADSNYTVGNLISDLANGAASASGVPIGVLPDNSRLLCDLLGDPCQYVVRSSTYLAEINKVLSWIGYRLYADPFTGKISVIDPNNSPTQGSLDISFRSDELLSASFEINYENIATTVVAGDDVSGEAVAYGHLADTTDDKNFDLRKLAKVAFVTTYNVKKGALSDVAKSVFDLSRQGSQRLSIEFAGYKKQSLLWNALSWTDANGNLGDYKISDYTVSVSPRGVTTKVEAVL